MFAAIRAFFAERGVLEVDTPVLCASMASDPGLESFGVDTATSRRYLATSPEFAMKRLLAAGSGPIYQLGHVFRAAESGRWHNPEFCMLEWYRPDVGYRRLMTEVAALLGYLAPGAGACGERAFADVFAAATGVDPLRARTRELRALAGERDWAPGRYPEDAEPGARGFWLDLIMGVGIGPSLGHQAPCFVYDYPAEQAMLTRVRPGSPPVAERFELYWRGVELANGGNELTDADTFVERHEADQRRRQAAGMPSAPLDRRLLGALRRGLPECAGVALGIDRLLALALDLEGLAAVLPFAWERA